MIRYQTTTINGIAPKSCSYNQYFFCLYNSELKLKTLGLECLVTIMKSLVDWSKDLRLGFEEKGNLTSSIYQPIIPLVLTLIRLLLRYAISSLSIQDRKRPRIRSQ